MIKFFKSIQTRLFFNSPFYNFLTNNIIDKKIQYNPESLWRGNKLNGKKIVDGFLDFQKETIHLDDKVWVKNHGSLSWNKFLNSFMWIPDVRAVGTNQARIFLRKHILNWLNDSDYSNQLIWDLEVLSKRIFYMITNLSFFFETAEESFQKKFSENINKQCIFLLKQVRKEKKSCDEIFAIKSLLLSTLCFNNLKIHYKLSLDLLLHLIKNKITKDGMHYLRSPSEHFFFLCSIIDIKNFLGGLKKEIPFEINKCIEEMTTVIKFFRLGNGQLAIFNKYDFIKVNKLENLLKKVNHKFKLPKVSFCSGFYRASKNKLNFIMDCGKPTSQTTHAGSLSFECSYLSEKIIVNCGSPFVNNKDWNDAMRSTAAHSTLNINEINSSDIFFDQDTTTRIAEVWSDQFEEEDNICINTSHDGYKKLFGIIHKRLIHIDLKNLIIRGEESFGVTNNYEKKKDLNFFLRFHIHPNIQLNVTSSKKKVVLRLRNNNGWEFMCSEPKVEIGDGIYLGEDKVVQANQHILLKDRIEKNKKISWLFRSIK